MDYSCHGKVMGPDSRAAESGQAAKKRVLFPIYLGVISHETYFLDFVCSIMFP